jgi:hypothetical protein
MYVTPPDTDVYAIPKVLAPMPQKVLLSFFFLVSLSNFGEENAKLTFIL